LGEESENKTEERNNRLAFFIMSGDTELRNRWYVMRHSGLRQVAPANQEWRRLVEYGATMPRRLVNEYALQRNATWQVCLCRACGAMLGS